MALNKGALAASSLGTASSPGEPASRAKAALMDRPFPLSAASTSAISAGICTGQCHHAGKVLGRQDPHLTAPDKQVCVTADFASITARSIEQLRTCFLRACSAVL